MASKQETKGKQGSAAEDEAKQPKAASKNGKDTHKSNQSSDSHDQEEKSASKKAENADKGELDFASLVEMLQGDLTTVDAETAIEAIDQWYSILHKADAPELKEMSEGLKELKRLLKLKKPHTTEIGDVLSELGEQATEYAADAERGTKGHLQKIGKALTKLGESLIEPDEEDEE